MTDTTRYPNSYVLNVMSHDHPGIVAAVTSAVESLNGNIDSCSQTVLRGYFTLIMIVSLPSPMDPDELAEKVMKSSEHVDLDVCAREALPVNACETTANNRFVITAFGEDQPGIVRKFSEYLADREINILDLFGGRRINADNKTEFVLTGQVEIPLSWNLSMLQSDLEQMGNELGFTVKLQHENIFVATNQLRLPK